MKHLPMAVATTLVMLNLIEPANCSENVSASGLLAHLKAKERSSQRKAAESILEQRLLIIDGLADILTDTSKRKPHWGIRYEAIRLLGKMHVADKRTIDLLVENFHFDPSEASRTPGQPKYPHTSMDLKILGIETTQPAWLALVRIGRPALPQLQQWLHKVKSAKKREFLASVIRGIRERNPDVQSLPLEMRARNNRRRKQADEALHTLRKQFYVDLRATVLERNDNRFGGPKHLAIQHLGRWRFEEATPLLTKVIDWTIDRRTIPRDERNEIRTAYPAAAALVQIGSSTVLKEMLEIIKTTNSETRRRLSCWVFSEIYGRSVGEQLLVEERGHQKSLTVRQKLQQAIQTVRNMHGEIGQLLGTDVNQALIERND